MDAFLNKVFAYLKEHALVLYAGIGMGIYRCTHEWPVWFNGMVNIETPIDLFTDDFSLLLDASKIVGILIFLVLCYSFDKEKKHGILLVLPSALVVAGCLFPLMYSLGVPNSNLIMGVSLLFIGAGAGMLFAQWIEFCGFMAPVKVIQVLALSYIVRFLFLPILTTTTTFISVILLILVSGSSFAQVFLCYRHVPRAESWARSLPNRKDVSSFGIFFIWVFIFAFAYGLGTSSTLLSHSTYEAGWGKVLPSIFILILSLKLGDRFDRNILYTIALPLMTAGLICIEFLGINPSLSQVLLSAAFSSFHLLVYAMVSFQAYQSRTSAMFFGACVRILALVAADAAVILARLFPFFNSVVFTTVTIVASILVGVWLFLPRSNSYPDHYQLQANKETSRQKHLSDLAEAAGLSRRETTVFQLLMLGKTSTEISNELFISNGAVRAHCSRIYDKFGVHSRKDFDALFFRE